MQTLNVCGKPPVNEDEFAKIPYPMMLIGEITRLMGEKLRENGDDNPIKQKSGRDLLIELSKKDGKTQLDLVKATHLKAPTISVSLQKLEHDGIVRREPDQNDMRAMRVYLTDKGKEIDERNRKRIHDEEIEATKVLTDSECEQLTALLTKIRDNLLANRKEDSEEY